VSAANGGGLPEREIRLGLMYAHDRANANTTELEQAVATIEALVELLVEAGLEPERIEEAKARATERVRRRFTERGMAVIRQDFDVPKREFEGGAEIDCEARVHLCKAACCRLLVGLSGEDIREGILRWDTGNPYALDRGEDGWCVHMERGSCRCTVYDARPIPCRGFDCREDKRIWLDFEGRVPNPALSDPNWPQNVTDDG
jgi:Putative zinc- or iron-chelating domain